MIDAITIAKEILQKRGAPTSILGSLVGIDSSRLSQYFSRKLAVPNSVATELEKAARELDKVCQCFMPARLDFRDYITIKMLIEKHRAGKLYARVLVDEPVTEETK